MNAKLLAGIFTAIAVMIAIIAGRSESRTFQAVLFGGLVVLAIGVAVLQFRTKG